MSKRYLPYLVYLILSVLVVLFAGYVRIFTHYLLFFYQWIDVHLAIFFSSSTAGTNLRHVFSLVIYPLIITGIPALLYRLIKGNTMPHLLEATWLIWILLVLSTLFVQ